MTEHINLELVFEERRIRGSDIVQYGVKVTEIDAGSQSMFTEPFDATEFYDAPNWEEFKKQFPTIEDILEMSSGSVFWRITSDDEERTMRAVRVKGHEGLYEYKGKPTFKCYV